jgi:hypothetical protein
VIAAWVWGVDGQGGWERGVPEASNGQPVKFSADGQRVKLSRLRTAAH